MPGVATSLNAVILASATDRYCCMMVNREASSGCWSFFFCFCVLVGKKVFMQFLLVCKQWQAAFRLSTACKYQHNDFPQRLSLPFSKTSSPWHRKGTFPSRSVVPRRCHDLSYEAASKSRSCEPRPRYRDAGHMTSSLRWLTLLLPRRTRRTPVLLRRHADAPRHAASRPQHPRYTQAP